MKKSQTIEDLINEVAPPPLAVSETAIRQLRPLLEELLEYRRTTPFYRVLIGLTLLMCCAFMIGLLMGSRPLAHAVPHERMGILPPPSVPPNCTTDLRKN